MTERGGPQTAREVRGLISGPEPEGSRVVQERGSSVIPSRRKIRIRKAEMFSKLPRREAGSRAGPGCRLMLDHSSEGNNRRGKAQYIPLSRNCVARGRGDGKKKGCFSNWGWGGKKRGDEGPGAHAKGASSRLG